MSELEIKSHKNVKIMKAPIYLVNYTDGHGKNETKLAFIVGEEVRFLQESALTKAAQQWLKNDILMAAGLKTQEGPRDDRETAIPMPVSPPTLDEQV